MDQHQRTKLLFHDTEQLQECLGEMIGNCESVSIMDKEWLLDESFN